MEPDACVTHSFSCGSPSFEPRALAHLARGRTVPAARCACKHGTPTTRTTVRVIRPMPMQLRLSQTNAPRFWARPRRSLACSQTPRPASRPRAAHNRNRTWASVNPSSMQRPGATASPANRIHDLIGSGGPQDFRNAPHRGEVRCPRPRNLPHPDTTTHFANNLWQHASHSRELSAL